MDSKPSLDDVPYGWAALRRVPREAVATAFLLGLLAVSAPFWLHEDHRLRNLLCLLGVVLVDFGLSGRRAAWLRALRTRLVPWLKWGLIGLGIAVGLGALGLGKNFLLRRDEKLAARASAVLVGSAVVRETAGIARTQDLAVIPLAGAVPDLDRLPQAVAVYDGLRRLPASVLKQEGTAQVVVSLDIGAREERPLDLFFGAGFAPLDMDPEQNWDLSGAYRSALDSFSWSVEGARDPERVPPFFGDFSLRIQVDPTKELPRPYLWADLPVQAPKPISPSTQLLYAIRTEGSSTLRGMVQLNTDRGVFWATPEVDQEGRAADPLADPGDRATNRWFLRRVPLGKMAGARIRSVAIVVLDPAGTQAPPQQAIIRFDAIRIVEGPTLEAEFLGVGKIS
jgi:hypothetical protein